MGKYSKNSKTAALVVAITVFASLLLFSIFFDFSIDTQIWLVNIFTALTFGSIVYLILHVSRITSESLMLAISAIVALIFLFFNPVTLPAEEETIGDTVEQEVPEDVQEEMDTIYDELQDDKL